MRQIRVHLLPGQCFGQLLSPLIVNAAAPEVESLDGSVSCQRIRQQADVLCCQAVAAAEELALYTNAAVLLPPKARTSGLRISSHIGGWLSRCTTLAFPIA